MSEREWFVVTIKRTRVTERTSSRYKQVRDYELAKSLGLDKTHDYVTGTETETESADVYEQRVEVLDLAAVIKAVNGL